MSEGVELELEGSGGKPARLVVTEDYLAITWPCGDRFDYKVKDIDEIMLKLINLPPMPDLWFYLGEYEVDGERAWLRRVPDTKDEFEVMDDEADSVGRFKLSNFRAAFNAALKLEREEVPF